MSESKKQLEIEINGKKYPYKETMGAMMDFKQETGLDSPVDTETTLKYMYHVVKAMCRRSGQECDLTYQQFLDGLDGDEFLRIVNENRQDPAEGDEKNA